MYRRPPESERASGRRRRAPLWSRALASRPGRMAGDGVLEAARARHPAPEPDRPADERQGPHDRRDPRRAGRAPRARSSSPTASTGSGTGCCSRTAPRSATSTIATSSRSGVRRSVSRRPPRRSSSLGLRLRSGCQAARRAAAARPSSSSPTPGWRWRRSWGSCPIRRCPEAPQLGRRAPDGTRGTSRCGRRASADVEHGR